MCSFSFLFTDETFFPAAFGGLTRKAKWHVCAQLVKMACMCTAVLVLCLPGSFETVPESGAHSVLPWLASSKAPQSCYLCSHHSTGRHEAVIYLLCDAGNGAQVLVFEP